MDDVTDPQHPRPTRVDLTSVGYRPAGADDSVRGNRTYWDGEASGYRAEHAGDLAGGLVWGPEGLTEATAGLLGEVGGRQVLEVGAGAGDGAAWLNRVGARAVASDLSIGMLRTAPAGHLPRAQCDARSLPFADQAFDLAFTAYGAVPFVADPERIHAEVFRVLRPGGRWVFSITHPTRWSFPDDPGPPGLRVTRAYFDRTPYSERGADGQVTYAEHHRTLGDRVRELVSAGFDLVDLVEPEWPVGLERTWGGWSPMRGRLIPGTAIFVGRRPLGHESP